MAYLLDYEGSKTDLPNYFLEDVEDIVAAWIRVDTGDETLITIRKNGDKDFASVYSAWQMYYDGDYDIIKNGKWIVDEDAWNKRTNSYQFLISDM